ncbi:hypothetical protein ACEYW6_10405 [Nostoc sp. UIC 10607]|uniref:hypothetical protein n=1 Tax=Nostoc sp. UIC 10607 TaxID=3045935 RepID=UPI0039A3183D
MPFPVKDEIDLSFKDFSNLLSIWQKLLEKMLEDNAEDPVQGREFVLAALNILEIKFLSELHKLKAKVEKDLKKEKKKRNR